MYPCLVGCILLEQGKRKVLEHLAKADSLTLHHPKHELAQQMSHSLDFSKPDAKISLNGVGDMERNNLEEDEDVPDEEVVIKTKKWGVQKMMTCDLVEAMQPSSHQCPGNSTVASNSWALFAHPPPLGVKVKGSTGRSSHYFATQPPATPTATPIPTSYLNEDDDIVKFTNPAQESTAKDYDEFVEVTDFNDIRPFSVTLLPPSQPRDEVIDKGDEHEHQDVKPPQSRGSKRSSLSQLNVEASQSTSAPPSKRLKMKQEGTEVPSGKGSGKKFTNKDLPDGSHIGNTFCSIYSIWNVIYCNRIEHEVTVKGAVYAVVKQHIVEWRSGFEVTVLMVVAMFFIQNCELCGKDAHETFTGDMLHCKCFLFSHDDGDDYMEWTGIWQNPFIIQTFALHFNFIANHVEIPALDSKNITAHGALALAVTAVYRALSLIVHGHIELNQLLDGVKVSNCGLVVKDNASTWEVVVPDGQGTGFNEQTWGELTRKYLQPITDLSQENFMKIVEEMVCYVKSSTKEKSTTVSTSDDKEATNFFNFH
ncbi:hypothetical protein SCLCIDRAFT_8802 [Scleroderma citrinum Foug A]|uniref:Uncharacterized protein n=1 Tax=Scleroderma citrinum Foug A TaxID=1036808 RepID=A0A0C3E4U0_9AGAM|nr:hypothetical protein SCLCIDRAFT_8802 [Scleroderma citrinum Foug A]